MAGEKNIVIELNKGTVDEYIIKDIVGITIGRFSILEMDTTNRNCSVRIKFYRENNKALLKEAIILILKTIFKNQEIYKVNIFVSESINVGAFVDLGFNLQGILEENIVVNGSVKDEFIFGITAYDFRNQISRSPFTLRGSRIQLKLLTPENSKEVLDYYIRNKKHLKNFEPSRDESFYTEEVQRNILSENYRQYINGTSLNLGIYKDSEFIGKVQLSNIVQGVFKNAFLGYSIDENHQGKGYMKEAVSLVIDYAFEDMELHRIEASTLIDNVKSQAVLKACGFKELGINKGYLYINGGWMDHITFYKVN